MCRRWPARKTAWAKQLPSIQAMKSMKAMKAVRAAPKGEIANQLAESTGLKKSEVMTVLDNLADIGTKELKKAGKRQSTNKP